jgi:hypothetical protein
MARNSEKSLPAQGTSSLYSRSRTLLNAKCLC